MKHRVKIPPRRVAVLWDRSLRGTVVAEGPSQTEVRLDGEKTSRIFINGDLIGLRQRAVPAKKRELKR